MNWALCLTKLLDSLRGYNYSKLYKKIEFIKNISKIHSIKVERRMS